MLLLSRTVMKGDELCPILHSNSEEIPSVTKQCCPGGALSDSATEPVYYY